MYIYNELLTFKFWEIIKIAFTLQDDQNELSQCSIGIDGLKNLDILGL